MMIKTSASTKTATTAYIQYIGIYRYLDQNPQKNIGISLIVCEKTDYMCFPLHLEKMEKESQFWEKNYKLALYPAHQNEDPLEFCDYLQLLIYRDFHINKFLMLKCRSRSRCITFAMAPFDGKYMTSYLMAIV